MKQKIIYNRILPWHGFSCVNLFGILFVRRGVVLTERMLNHEAIHTAQMKEMLYVGFYVWYFVEWLIEVFHYGTTAYHTNSFERECYAHDDDLTYLENRDRFAWMEYV